VKLLDHLPPEHAKYEDYKVSVRKDLVEQLTQAAMAAMRQKLGGMALASMKIKDPVLAEQWQQRVDKKNGELHDLNAIRQKMDQAHSTTTGPSTVPSTEPSTMPAATIPAAPAATVPASATPASATGPATAPAAN
jgi:hypothetical protein